MESVSNVRIDSSRNYSNAATNLYQSATNIDRGIWGLVDCSRVEEGRSGQTALRTTNVSTNKRVKRPYYVQRFGDEASSLRGDLPSP